MSEVTEAKTQGKRQIKIQYTGDLLYRVIYSSDRCHGADFHSDAYGRSDDHADICDYTGSSRIRRKSFLRSPALYIYYLVQSVSRYLPTFQAVLISLLDRQADFNFFPTDGIYHRLRCRAQKSI